MRDSPAQWCWPRRRDLVPIRLLRCLERGTLGVATDEGVTRDCYAGFTNCESRPARGPRRPKRGAPTPSGPWASAVAGMRRLSPHQMTPTGTRLPDGYHQELEDHRPSSRGGRRWPCKRSVAHDAARYGAGQRVPLMQARVGPSLSASTAMVNLNHPQAARAGRRGRTGAATCVGGAALAWKRLRRRFDQVETYP